MTSTVSRPVELHLVTGFLGSGKTTLLRRLLDRGMYGERVVVLVNEFGDVGIDGSLLRRSGRQVVELASGCVCCQIGNDMLASVFSMIATWQPEHIVIELTGVAEPGRVLSALTCSSDLMEKARLEPTICVVDCHAFPRLGPEEEYFFYCQAQASDIILLNKTDLVDAEDVARVEDAVHASNPRALVIPTRHCSVDLRAIFAACVPPAEAHAEASPAEAHAEASPAEAHAEASPAEAHAEASPAEAHAEASPVFDSCTWRDASLVLDRERLEAWLDAMPVGVLRVKGTVRLDGGAFFLNHVGGHSTWEPACEGDPSPNTLVFIGRGFDVRELLSTLSSCRRQRGRGLRLSG